MPGIWLQLWVNGVRTQLTVMVAFVQKQYKSIWVESLITHFGNLLGKHNIYNLGGDGLFYKADSTGASLESLRDAMYMSLSPFIIDSSKYQGLPPFRIDMSRDPTVNLYGANVTFTIA